MVLLTGCDTTDPTANEQITTALISAVQAIGTASLSLLGQFFGSVFSGLGNLFQIGVLTLF